MTEAKKRLTDIAIAHYRERLRGRMSELEVPEWGVTIYWHAWTLEEKSRCWRPGGVDPTVYADVIITKACDAEGKPLVSSADRTEILGEWDPDIVERIGNAIMRDVREVTSAEGFEAIKGN